MSLKTAKNILFKTAFLLLPLFYAAAAFALDVVVVKSADIKPYNDAVEGFRASCNCSIEELDLSEAEHNDITRQVHKLNPDAVLAVGLDALKHLQSLKDLPVVYTMAPNVGSGLSARKNISGVDMDISPEAYINAMTTVLGNIKRIGLVYDPKNMDPFVAEAIQFAETKGMAVLSKKASRPGEVPHLIDGMKGKIDLFWMLPDTTVVNSVAVDYLLLFSFQNKVPVFTFSRKFVDMGALFALSIDPHDMGAQAAEVVKTLLSRNIKGPLRVDARKPLLTINRKVMTKFGIKIRDEVMKKADVIN